MINITVLTENTCHRDNLECEHGLSLYIETSENKILFDTGQTDLFYKNAEKLNIDLKDVDIMVLSHGHYDHGGGIEKFLEINKKAKLYINENAFNDHYSNNGEKYIGLNKNLKENKRIIFTSDETVINDKLILFTGNNLKRPYFMDNYGICEKVNGKIIKDKFLHEQYLLIKDSENTLISGCSHKGILNIISFAEKYNIKNIVGGFHYKKLDLVKEKDYLQGVCNELNNKDYMYYTCHCTGYDKYLFMKEIMKDKLEYISVGDKIVL